MPEKPIIWLNRHYDGGRGVCFMDDPVVYCITLFPIGGTNDRTETK